MKRKFKLNQIYNDGVQHEVFFTPYDEQGFVVLNKIHSEGQITKTLHRCNYDSNGQFEFDLEAVLYPNQEVKAQKQPAKQQKKKPDVVEVIRYIRPVGWEDDNLYGVTLQFILDYKKRTVDVGISVCNGDNFDKKVGIHIARNTDNRITGLYMPKDFGKGIVQWFIEDSPTQNEHNTEAQYNISVQMVANMLWLYENSNYAF